MFIKPKIVSYNAEDESIKLEYDNNICEMKNIFNIYNKELPRELQALNKDIKSEHIFKFIKNLKEIKRVENAKVNFKKDLDVLTKALKDKIYKFKQISTRDEYIKSFRWSNEYTNLKFKIIEERTLDNKIYYFKAIINVNKYNKRIDANFEQSTDKIKWDYVLLRNTPFQRISTITNINTFISRFHTLIDILMYRIQLKKNKEIEKIKNEKLKNVFIKKIDSFNIKGLEYSKYSECYRNFNNRNDSINSINIKPSKKNDLNLNLNCNITFDEFLKIKKILDL